MFKAPDRPLDYDVIKELNGTGDYLDSAAMTHNKIFLTRTNHMEVITRICSLDVKSYPLVMGVIEAHSCLPVDWLNSQTPIPEEGFPLTSNSTSDFPVYTMTNFIAKGEIASPASGYTPPVKPEKSLAPAPGGLQMNFEQPFVNLGSVSQLIEQKRQVVFASAGVNQLTMAVDLVYQPGFDMLKWIHESFIAYSFISKAYGMAVWSFGPSEFDTVLAEIRFANQSITFSFSGTYDGIQKFKEWLGTQPFSKKEIMVEWVFGPNYRDMEQFSLPLKIHPDIGGAYPWMKMSIKDYTDAFMGSKECVLVLKGAPGTGKTSFIKKMIEAAGTSAMVTYDAALLHSDGFFASFMTRDETNILVIEDADTMLTARTEGNPLMDKLLNASEGLISLQHKKIIFSTNLGNVSSIDPALLRKGRCFDILDFRRMTKDEAQLVANNYYGKEVEIPKQENYSLAEVTNLDLNGVRQGVTIKKAGFV